MIYLTQGLLLGLYAGILPGPFQAFMLSQSLQNGWRRALPLALVPLLTDLPVMLLLLTLLSQIPDLLLNLLRFGGGFYLLYLAWNTLKKVKNGAVSASASSNPPAGSFIQSILINYLNPNVYIFWGTVGVPIILEGLENSPLHGMGFILGFYLTLILVLSVLIYFFGSVGKFNPRLQQIMAVFLTLMLFTFGGYMIWQGAGFWIS
jgi:threonine/homoserine/homoserine lactone efflux protein